MFCVYSLAEETTSVSHTESTKRKFEETQQDDSSVIDASFPSDSALENKMFEKIVVDSDSHDFKSLLGAFKSTFDSSYGSAKLYYQTEDGQLVAMIVADNEMDFSAAKESLQQFLSNPNQGSQKRFRPANLDSENVSITVQVPKSCVGLLIGKSGASLRVIEIATSTKINVAQEDDLSGPVPMRTVTVSGLPEKIPLARKEIEKAAIDPKESGSSHANGPGSLTDEDIATFKQGPSKELTLPSAAIRYLIGKQGETIRVLQIHYNVFIQVAEGHKGEDGHPEKIDKTEDRAVTIYGTEENIAAVMTEVDLIRRAVETNNPSMMRENSNILRQTVEHTQEIIVGADVIGLIIGRRGDCIKTLQSRTNTSIQVEQAPSGAPAPSERKVTVSGRSEASVNNAINMIHDIINNKGQMNMPFGDRQQNPNWNPNYNQGQGGNYNQGGYRQQGGFNRQHQGGGFQGGNQGGYNQGGYNQGGYNQGGYNRNWNQGQQGGMNQGQGGSFNRGGNWNAQQGQGGFQPRHGGNQGGYNRQPNQGGYEAQGQSQQGGFNNYNQGRAQGQSQPMNAGFNAPMNAGPPASSMNPEYMKFYTSYYSYYKSQGFDESQAQRSAHHYAQAQQTQQQQQQHQQQPF